MPDSGKRLKSRRRCCRNLQQGYVNVAGSCCSGRDICTPSRKLMKALPPRAVPAPDHKLRLSGLEAMNIGKGLALCQRGESAPT